MKMLDRLLVATKLVASFAFLIFGLTGPIAALAASSPSLGAAATFGVLSGTFTPTIANTAITGDLGYTTLSTPLFFTVSGNTYTDVSGVPAGAVYQQAKTDMLAALNTGTNNLNNQVCTDIGPATALNGVDIDGAGPIAAGHFVPGCYFSSGALGIVATTKIYLDGAGTYIFKSTDHKLVRL